jgi:hypothetical protein
MVASADELLSFSSLEERKRRFFAQTSPIPLQAIRYGGEEGRFVGCVSLTPRVGKGIVDLGYYLHPYHQRRGVMVAAGTAVLGWARDAFGVTRVYSRYVSLVWRIILLRASNRGDAVPSTTRARTDWVNSADCMNPGSGKVIERVAAKTSVGEVKKGEKILSWPVEKVVTGRKVDSLSRTWEWSI